MLFISKTQSIKLISNNVNAACNLVNISQDFLIINWHHLWESKVDTIIKKSSRIDKEKSS